MKLQTAVQQSEQTRKIHLLSADLFGKFYENFAQPLMPEKLQLETLPKNFEIYFTVQTLVLNVPSMIS